MNPFNRSLLSIGMAALLVSPAPFGFQSPLSDESVRDAYFLGQRHDGSSRRSRLRGYLDHRGCECPDSRNGG